MPPNNESFPRHTNIRSFVVSTKQTSSKQNQRIFFSKSQDRPVREIKESQPLKKQRMSSKRNRSRRSRSRMNINFFMKKGGRDNRQDNAASPTIQNRLALSPTEGQISYSWEIQPQIELLSEYKNMWLSRDSVEKTKKIFDIVKAQTTNLANDPLTLFELKVLYELLRIPSIQEFDYLFIPLILEKLLEYLKGASKIAFALVFFVNSTYQSRLGVERSMYQKMRDDIEDELVMTQLKLVQSEGLIKQKDEIINHKTEFITIKQNELADTEQRFFNVVKSNEKEVKKLSDLLNENKDKFDLALKASKAWEKKEASFRDKTREFKDQISRLEGDVMKLTDENNFLSHQRDRLKIENQKLKEARSNEPQSNQLSVNYYKLKAESAAKEKEIEKLQNQVSGENGEKLSEDQKLKKLFSAMNIISICSKSKEHKKLVDISTSTFDKVLLNRAVQAYMPNTQVIIRENVKGRSLRNVVTTVNTTIKAEASKNKPDLLIPSNMSTKKTPRKLVSQRSMNDIDEDDLQEALEEKDVTLRLDIDVEKIKSVAKYFQSTNVDPHNLVTENEGLKEKFTIIQNLNSNLLKQYNKMKNEKDHTESVFRDFKELHSDCFISKIVKNFKSKSKKKTRGGKGNINEDADDENYEELLNTFERIRDKSLLIKSTNKGESANFTSGVLVREIKQVIRSHLRKIYRTGSLVSYDFRASVFSYFLRKYDLHFQAEKHLLKFILSCLDFQKVPKIRLFCYMISINPQLSYNSESSTYAFGFINSMLSHADCFFKEDREYMLFETVVHYIRTMLGKTESSSLFKEIDALKVKLDLVGVQTKLNPNNFFIDIDESLIVLVRHNTKILKKNRNWLLMLYEAGSLILETNLKLSAFLNLYKVFEGKLDEVVMNEIEMLVGSPSANEDPDLGQHLFLIVTTSLNLFKKEKVLAALGASDEESLKEKFSTIRKSISILTAKIEDKAANLVGIDPSTKKKWLDALADVKKCFEDEFEAGHREEVNMIYNMVRMRMVEYEIYEKFYQIACITM